MKVEIRKKVVIRMMVSNLAMDVLPKRALSLNLRHYSEVVKS